MCKSEHCQTMCKSQHWCNFQVRGSFLRLASRLSSRTHLITACVMLNPTLIGAAALLRSLLTHHISPFLSFDSPSQDSRGPAWLFRSPGHPTDCELASGGGDNLNLSILIFKYRIKILPTMMI